MTGLRGTKYKASKGIWDGDDCNSSEKLRKKKWQYPLGGMRRDRHIYGITNLYVTVAPQKVSMDGDLLWQQLLWFKRSLKEPSLYSIRAEHTRNDSP